MSYDNDQSTVRAGPDLRHFAFRPSVEYAMKDDTSANPNADYARLSARLSSLLLEAMDITPTHPFKAQKQIWSIRKKLESLRNRVEQLSANYENHIEKRNLNELANIVGVLLALNLFRRSMNIQMLWNEVCSALEQKQSHAFSYLALYIAIISIILTLALSLPQFF